MNREDINREDIIRMAREAGMQGMLTDVVCTHEELARFAALVAAVEREKVARWQIGSAYTTGHGDTIKDLLVELEWQVREAEREVCAKIVEEYCGAWDDKGYALAAAIRARGQV